MPLLIDGYNLIHAAGILGHGVGPNSLERARRALLNVLAESLPPEERMRTVVVFDAAEAPPGLPRRLKYRDLRVKFASEHEDADALIEELIARDSAPKKLTVVSSDHRVQRAARRRRARHSDSDVWFAELLRRRHEHTETSDAEDDAKPLGPLSEHEVQYWLHHFHEPETAPSVEWLIDSDDPFPPGYAEPL